MKASGKLHDQWISDPVLGNNGRMWVWKRMLERSEVVVSEWEVWQGIYGGFIGIASSESLLHFCNKPSLVIVYYSFEDCCISILLRYFAFIFRSSGLRDTLIS